MVKGFVSLIKPEIYWTFRPNYDDNKEIVKRTDSKPRRFSLKQKNNLENDNDDSKNSKQQELTDNFEEKDMYEPIINFLESRDIKAMRINESTSQKNQGEKGNEWLHPDIVAIKDLFKNLDSNTSSFAITSKLNQFELYSFEIKKRIEKSQVRKIISQTILNSSWSNKKYLIFSDCADGALKELTLLCKNFEIGLWKINFFRLEDGNLAVNEVEEEDIEGFEEIIPPIKKDINLDLMQRITEQNDDYKLFLEWIKKSIKIGEIFSFNPKKIKK